MSKCMIKYCRNERYTGAWNNQNQFKYCAKHHHLEDLTYKELKRFGNELKKVIKSDIPFKYNQELISDVDNLTNLNNDELKEIGVNPKDYPIFRDTSKQKR